ncbi:DarT ssDNA thymidine ADP-ribosyltransferase family protein [uncultured Parvimonas sp.]|uniref:DarT ssDNA thymidine ADP-ribosyltransferase family protein n=1 Tax=uncultured Parvimonas sp. TaxID=747372 RepID=UPI0025957B1C|nr:DarT ssDNA thymidine ADP-ribosyltransferase family protein [uncultured Parvimonas sp.]
MSNKIKEGQLLYHLTKLSNLNSIIHNGLVCRKNLTKKNIKFLDVADLAILNKRKSLDLDSFVPFHFHPYSSFDVAVKNSYKSEEFIYICCLRSLAKEKGFKILPKHPLSDSEYKIFDYEDGIIEIDWEAMESSSTDSVYCKNVRMAECLCYSEVPVSDFYCIYVKNIEVKNFVENELQNYNGVKPFVYKQECWFDL